MIQDLLQSNAAFFCHLLTACMTAVRDESAGRNITFQRETLAILVIHTPTLPESMEILHVQHPHGLRCMLADHKRKGLLCIVPEQHETLLCLSVFLGSYSLNNCFELGIYLQTGGLLGRTFTGQRCILWAG